MQVGDVCLVQSEVQRVLLREGLWMQHTKLLGIRIAEAEAVDLPSTG
jgi:hypothetical protein